MQYGNPYFAQPFQQIQPYQDRLAQLQNSYQQAMPYGQAQIQQPIQQMPQVPQIPFKVTSCNWITKHIKLCVCFFARSICLAPIHGIIVCAGNLRNSRSPP